MSAGVSEELAPALNPDVSIVFLRQSLLVVGPAANFHAAVGLMSRVGTDYAGIDGICKPACLRPLRNREYNK